MKINEKTLISFASSSAPCDREGWLLKRGEVKIIISHLIKSSLKNLLNSIFLKGYIWLILKYFPVKDQILRWIERFNDAGVSWEGIFSFIAQTRETGQYSITKKQTFSFLSFREPLGVIILEGCTVELAEEETEVYAFKIQFHGDGKTMGRTYSLGTQTMEDLEQWMKLVRYVIQIVFFCSINPGGLK